MDEMRTRPAWPAAERRAPSDDLRETRQALLAKVDQLERANRALADFAISAAHDLQAPLRKLDTFTERLRLRLEGLADPEARDLVERISRAARNMTELTSSLLEFARAAATPAWETVDLDEVVEGALRELEQDSPERRTAVEIEALAKVRGDPRQLRRLFLNLLSNALKFHSPESPPRVRVRAIRSARGFLDVSVSDQGVGFEQRHAERLFQPFTRLHSRRDFEGCGLGLAICSRIAAQHGGSITAAASPGKGATFTIRLPLAQEAQDGP